jgi:hypothetical protein
MWNLTEIFVAIVCFESRLERTWSVACERKEAEQDIVKE